jgi:hypothetical protein
MRVNASKGLAFTSGYFFESRLFNRLRAKKIKKFPSVPELVFEVVFDAVSSAWIMPHRLARTRLDPPAVANGIAQITDFTKQCILVSACQDAVRGSGTRVCAQWGCGIEGWIRQAIGRCGACSRSAEPLALAHPRPLLWGRAGVGVARVEDINACPLSFNPECPDLYDTLNG